MNLIPAIVRDARTGAVLTLAYMNEESLARTRETGETWFWSRSRNELWHKGATSGNTQRVVHIAEDCDRDALVVSVEPSGPACHTGSASCFADVPPLPLERLMSVLRSRFTDFLTSDGEKPDRDRDGEFVILPGETRADVEATWAEGWAVLEATLHALTADDLLRTIQIRGEAHTALGALNRSLAHVANHAGQVTLLARHYAGGGWRTLTIPRGQSKTYRP